MTINGITADDLVFITYAELQIGDRIARVHRPLKSHGVRPTAKQMAHAASIIVTVETITPYIPKPGAANASIADTIMNVNDGLPTWSTGLKTAGVWIVRR